MCGYLVSVGTDLWDTSFFESALKLQYHRGPDAFHTLQTDCVQMGFCRLNIIDLSEASMQPIRSGSTVVVMNGEIYNYRDLRSELSGQGAHFHSRGDAEVLAAAIEMWGAEKALQRARGMWSCVAYNLERQELFISRDRLGIKPLWWSIRNGRLLLAAEIKSLLALEPSLRELNPHVAASYISDGVLDEGTSTFYRSIFNFPPGHLARVDPHRPDVHPRPYWTLSCTDSDVSISELSREFSTTMHQHFHSDVPVALTLSGGIDSTLICGHAREVNLRRCYSLDHPVADQEKNLIDATVQAWDLNHVYVPCADVESVDTIDSLLKVMDQPFRATQTLYQYGIRRAAAADGFRVILTGDGADEVFGGYRYAIPYLIAGNLEAGRPDDARDIAQECSAFSGSSPESLLSEAHSIIKRKASGSSTIRRVPENPWHDCLSPELSQLRQSASFTSGYDSASTLKTFLAHRLLVSPMPYWLRVEDATAMSVSIETRVPFLDHKLVETSFRFPDRQFFDQGKNKAMLRAIAHDYLPNHVLQAPKKFQRPGSSSRLMFDILPGALEEELNAPHAGTFFQTRQLWHHWKLDRESALSERAEFWFRVFLFLRLTRLFRLN